MKRIQLFEFEDLPWFPNLLRKCMTRLIVVMHRLLGTREHLLALLKDVLTKSGQSSIVDLCSGSGGPMLYAFEELRREKGFEQLKLTMSDLYPNEAFAHQVNSRSDEKLSYLTTPLDATQVGNQFAGLRTMVSSFHHMPPELARKILHDAQKSAQPILIFEISDNSYPIWANFLALPINFIMCLLVTPLVRPMTWQQLVFTYPIPLIPLAFAWDGAISNARTYTLADLDGLLEDLPGANYRWEKGVIPTQKAKMLYLWGQPD